MASITFLNDNKEQIVQKDGRRALSERAKDFEFYLTYGDLEDEGAFIDKLYMECSEVSEILEACRKFEDLPEMNEYGLSYDYVELGTFDDQEEDYFCYQLSWGGPSEEIRFYESGMIEFVYLDWFCGVGFNVTHEEWAEFIRDWFEDIGMMDFERKREETDYYAKKMEQENEEEEE